MRDWGASWEEGVRQQLGSGTNPLSLEELSLGSGPSIVPGTRVRPRVQMKGDFSVATLKDFGFWSNLALAPSGRASRRKRGRGRKASSCFRPQPGGSRSHGPILAAQGSGAFLLRSWR